MIAFAYEYKILVFYHSSDHFAFYEEVMSFDEY